GRAGVGGAHVAATPAVWLAGAAGRTGGLDFFLRRRRVRRYSTATTIAATESRIIRRFVSGIRSRVLPSRLLRQSVVQQVACCVAQKYAIRAHGSPRWIAPFSLTRRPDATRGTRTS